MDLIAIPLTEIVVLPLPAPLKVAVSPVPGEGVFVQLPPAHVASVAPVQEPSAAWTEVMAQSETQTMREERESGAKAAIKERNLGFMFLLGILG
jgi:hypothetical protein